MARLHYQRTLVRLLSSLIVASPLVLALPSCQTASVDHVRWEPISDEEVLSAIQSPTGEVGSLPPSEILDLVEQTLPALLETAKFIGHLASVIDEVTNGDNDEEEEDLPEASEPPPSDDGSTWGSSLYLRIACPGDNLIPPYEFSDGEVRLDTPEFNGLNLSELTDGGQFLLSFDECRVGDLLWDTAIAGRFFQDVGELNDEVPADDPDLPLRALALDIGSAEVESPFGFIGYACGSSTTTCQNDVRVFAELDAGDAGSYVVALRVTADYWLGSASISVLIRGADAESSCTFAVSQPTDGSFPLGLSCESSAP